MSDNWDNEIIEAMMSLDEDSLINKVESALSGGISPLEILRKAITKGMQIVGEKYESGEFFLMHLMAIGEAVKNVMDKLLLPALQREGVKESGSEGTVVIGTVEGDIHDIGKNIVASMLLTAGFEVIDLGKDVNCDVFIQKAIEKKADIIAASALLSTTMIGQKKLIEELKKRNIRDRFKILIGGAPTSPAWAEEIGADGYAKDAVEAVKVAKHLLKKARDIEKKV
ncbi:MAG: corrinoid protein [Candidatus Odinarchaeum yellowstonii]|uniref:Corrinoid protein n=1 Tax=Odinarchaeota yellowstonii (strain LCB_4) TaxID=1841599 RepID=A0AAF0D316_ODILC|nr:MAG: corrinoid protein [Candidatus Odinarchaeum yellowstonii]